MSYDIYLAIDTGGEYPATVADVGNMTGNCGGQWYKALGCSLSALHGKNAGECIPMLEAAVSDMHKPENREAYKALDPPNGWGSLEHARTYLEDLLKACREHPKTTIRISC